MPSTVPIPLTPSGRRAQAAATLHTATALPELTCVALADALDAICAALLRSAGCDDDAARAVLGDLWLLTALTDPRNGEYREVPEAEQ